MVLSTDLINLVLYCVQQLGVTLSVGAETILLVAYVQAIRDGVVDVKEAQFSRAVRGVLNCGLMLIITSGVGITLLHMLAGESATIFSPAYLFKWGLIAVALVLTIASRYASQSILEGVAGGTWYALFLVHILAPVSTWSNLLMLYAVWLVGFTISWWALVLLFTGRKTNLAKSVDKIASSLPPKTVAPKPILPNMAPPKPIVTPAPPPVVPKVVVQTSPPPVVPKPVPMPPANLPVIVPTVPKPPIPQTSIGAVPTPPPPPKPSDPKIVDPDQDPGLPAIRVMPKTQQDLDTQNRATTVKFE